MVNLSRIDLNFLVALEAIVAESGVSRAAEKFNLIQPAVSHALTCLRDALDDPLFARQGVVVVRKGHPQMRVGFSLAIYLGDSTS
jgi:DNA-binding transcriptional LysR family regulator